MSYDLEGINTLFAQIAECMHRNPARAMRLLGQAKAKVREALERAALAAHKPDDGDAKDAERYRWLRVQPFEVWKRIAWNTWDDDPTVATQRDADIDAAIAQQGKGEGGP